MKKNLILTIGVTAAVLFSCSTDKIAEDIAQEQEEKFEELIGEGNEGETEEEKEAETNKSVMLLGTWEATELQIDANTASDQVKFGKQILDHLTNKECFIVTFTFNTDATVIAENSVNHLEINVGVNGLDIPCPEEKDMESSSYVYDGETLTLIDNNGTTLAVSATIEGDTMTVDAKDLDLPNFNEAGQLIFKKREG